LGGNRPDWRNRAFAGKVVVTAGDGWTMEGRELGRLTAGDVWWCTWRDLNLDSVRVSEGAEGTALRAAKLMDK
jgi:hypothetical protein